MVFDLAPLKHPCQPISHLWHVSTKRMVSTPQSEAHKAPLQGSFQWLRRLLTPWTPWTPYPQWKDPAWQHPARIQASLSGSGSRACNLRIVRMSVERVQGFIKEIAEITGLDKWNVIYIKQTNWKKPVIVTTQHFFILLVCLKYEEKGFKKHRELYI